MGRSLERPIFIDLRTESLARLEGVDCALVRSRQKPVFEGWTCYPLVDGPSAWLYGVSRAPAQTGALDALRQEHAQVDPLYRRVIASAQAGQGDLAREACQALTELLETHMQFEERELFPAAALALDPGGRVVRELGYEHQGVRAGLKRLPQVVEEMLAGTATVKTVEKMELDLLHMFEHHQEREEEAVFPWLERVLYPVDH